MTDEERTTKAEKREFPDLKTVIPDAKKRGKYVRKLVEETRRKFVQKLKAENPEEKRILACLGNQLTKLKRLIEDPEEKEVSWENPWVETRYYVKLQGKKIKGEPRARWGEEGSKLHTLVIPPANYEELTSEQAVDMVLGTGVLQAEIELFQLLTHHLAYIKRGDTVTHLIPGNKYGDLGDKLIKEGDTPAENRFGLRLMEKFFRPFTLWLGRWGEGENGEEYPYEDDLARACFQHHPEFRIRGTEDASGKDFEVSLVLEVHPLVIELNEEGNVSRAWYPVVAGLSFWPESAIPEYRLIDPSRWPAGDREELWDTIFKNLHVIVGDEKTAEEAAGEPIELRESAPDSPPLPPVETTIDATSEKAETLKTFTNITTEEETTPPPVSGPLRTVFPGYFLGKTRVDRNVAEAINLAYHVKLPTKLSRLQKWKDLEEQEIQAHLEEEGERAFDDLRQLTGDSDARGPLLRRSPPKAGNKEGEVILTPEAKQDLRRREGLRNGFIETDRGKEYYVRLCETGKRGLLEFGLSWSGAAEPLVEDWRKNRLEEVKKRRDAPLLWDQLEDKERWNQMAERASLFNIAPGVMDYLVSQVYKQGTNPIRINAEELCYLLWPDRRRNRLPYPANWKQTVDGVLQLLRGLEWKWKAYGEGGGGKGYGSFLGSWNYIGRGPGGHGDGNYFVDVQPEFLGCIRVFSNGTKRIRDGRQGLDALRFDFGKKLSKEENKELSDSGGYTTEDAGRIIYNAGDQFTPHQDKLSRFLESNITRKGDYALRENGHRKARSRDEASSPRLYDHAFCPILPEGKSYCGTLGHFTRKPEAGFTLAGGAGSISSKHNGGLMEVMGYVLPPGPSTPKKRRILSETLGNLKTVVVEAYEGIVAGRLGTEWIPLEQFEALEESKLCHKLSVYCFLAEEFSRARREKWEEQTNYQAPRTLEEAELAAFGELEGVTPPPDNALPTEENAFRGLPLRERLREVMNRRKVSGAVLAPLFGISKMTVSNWTTGKKPIPVDASPLLVRWIESGAAPTPEELAARRRRTEA